MRRHKAAIAIMLGLLTLGLWLRLAQTSSAQGTTLASLAASMTAGSWAELSGSVGITPALSNTGGAINTILGYSDDAVWDPVSQQLFFVGGDHNPSSTCPRFVSYTESTNTWQILQSLGSWSATWSPCGSTPMHGYNHTAIDSVNRKLYHRPFNSMVVRRYDLVSQVWTDLPAIPSNVIAYNSVAAGVAWFPERNSLIYTSLESDTTGAVAEFSETTQQWTRIAGNLPIGAYQNFAKYNPVHDVVLFGGGGGDTHMYKLNAAGQVTTLQDAPIPMGINNSVVTVDPVSGKYLIFGNANNFYVYDVNADTWSLQGGSVPFYSTPAYDPPLMAIVAAPVSTYGVNMFVRCVSTDCRIYLYKHYPDITAPSVSISSPAGTAVSGTIAVSADASDEVGGSGLVKVQFKLDGNNLGAEDTTAPYSVSWDSTAGLNGSHTLSAVAQDFAGNQTTATKAVTVSNAIPFNFSVSTPTNIIVTQGQSGTTTISTTPIAGTIEPVSFSVLSGVPAGTTASFSPSSCTPNCSTILTLASSGAAPVGSYSITVNATAGSVTHPVSFMFTVSSINASFTEKCGQPGRLSCFSFDDTSSLYYSWTSATVCDTALAGKTNYPIALNRSGPGNTAAVVQNGQCVYPTVDTVGPHSGGGALRFTIPTNSGADSSGYFSEPFKRNLDGTFPYIGPGSSSGNILYFQFYQKFDSNFLTTDFECLLGSCGGWKQSIWYGNPPNGSSSSGIESTMYNGFERGIPQMYGQQGFDDYGVQDVAGCPFAGSGYSSKATYLANPACVPYVADQWMEFTGRIEVRGTSNAPASRVQLWVNGQMVVDDGAAKVNWGGSDGNGYGQFLLSPYHTNKDSAQVHAEGHTWYDDVIVSTDPIPMVNGGIPTPDSTPPVITNVSVSGITTTAATITWTTDKLSDSRVDYGTTSSYGQTTTAAPLVTAHTVNLSGLTANTTYHYKVTSKDAGNNTGTSQDLTFSTVGPPIISAVLAASVTSLDATITWTTDKLSDSQVEYGTTTSYGSQTTLNTALVTAHSQLIPGLVPALTYNYRVKSRDAAGNLTTSPNYTFSTIAASPAPTNGLIGHWAFNEGSGTTTADLSSRNNNATLWPNIAPTWMTGQVGKALQFNATDNNGNDNDDPRVVLGPSFDVASIPFTISVWVNPADFTDWRAIFSKRNSSQTSGMRFDLGLSLSSGNVYLTQPGEPVDFEYSPPTNTWTHITVVAGTTDTRLYVNGTLQETLGAFTLGTAANANTVIGGTGEGIGGDNDPFKGGIDEVRVYDRALSASEIQQIYLSKAQRRRSGQVVTQ